MPEDQNNVSVNAGSTTDPVTPEEVKTGESATDLKAQYEELQTKLGSQGQELGEYRQFFQGISPLLDKLDEQPELVQAIIDGKVNSELAKAAAEGKVQIEDAAIVSKAHEEVKKDLGKEKYEKTDPAEIERLVTQQLEGVKKEFSQKLDDVEELRSFEKRVTDFVSSKEDFSEYAEGITQWFKGHPDQDDIEVAYNVVKGKALEGKVAAEASKAAAETAKELAANAAGGSSQGGTYESNQEAADALIAPRTNPNIL